MSNPKVAVAFDELIQASRKRQQNEVLASEIFGRNKADKHNSRAASKSSTKITDLASRITKATPRHKGASRKVDNIIRGQLADVRRLSQRSSSVTSTNSSRNNTPSRPSSANPFNARGARVTSSRLASALDSRTNIISSQRNPRGKGLSIKGKAGPFVVEASNFAPGTTAADIESALATEILDENGDSRMLSCRLIKSSPAVVAEMVFTEKATAEQVISTYHNQKADGRILKLELKRSGLSSNLLPPQINQADLHPSTEAALSEPQQPQIGGDDVMEDIEMAPEAPTTQDDRRSRSRNADPDVADGHYGFEDPPVSDASHDQVRHDDRRDRDSRDNRDNRDRDYDRDRERDRDARDRERDSHRDRGRDGRDRYDRRDERHSGSGSYHRDGRQESYNSRSSHYGNGVGGPPGRGVFGGGGPGPGPGPGPFSRGGGRMYSDDMMRGGARGRGGFGLGGYGRGRY